MPATKQQIRQIIADNNLSSVADVYSLLRDSFMDILQELISKAMHMLEAGINIIYIRDFLGHEDISTTMVYVRADNRLKNDAVNKLAPRVTGEAALPDWNKDKDLLQFLNSLK